MNSHRWALYGFASAVVLAGALAGCATTDKCGVGGCPGDAKLTANVQSLLDQHPELGPPNAIQVQAVDHVVYLNGTVSEGLDSRLAESVALQTPGVTRVVNTIGVSR